MHLFLLVFCSSSRRPLKLCLSQCASLVIFQHRSRPSLVPIQFVSFSPLPPKGCLQWLSTTGSLYRRIICTRMLAFHSRRDLLRVSFLHLISSSTDYELHTDITDDVTLDRLLMHPNFHVFPLSSTCKSNNREVSPNGKSNG